MNSANFIRNAPTESESCSPASEQHAREASAAASLGDVSAVLDMAETLERLCREGASLEQALNASHERVNELAHRTQSIPNLSSEDLSGRGSENEASYRDLHSSNFLQNWLAAAGELLGKKLVLAVTTQRGTVVQLAYRGVDAAPFRLQSDLVGKVAREAIYRKQPLHSIQASRTSIQPLPTQIDQDSIGEVLHEIHPAEAKGSSAKKHFSVGLNRLSQHASLNLNAIAFELEKSSGHAVLLYDGESIASGEVVVESAESSADAAMEVVPMPMVHLIKEIDTWYYIQRCHWSMRWMSAIDWCLSHPKSLLVPVAIIGALLVLPVPYYPRRECVFEPEFKQYLTSPVAGRIASCEVRPGDSVKAGQLLAKLDEDQLRRDLATAEAELDGATKKFDTAIATRASGEVAMAKVEIRRMQSRIDSLLDQLKHMEVRAVADGVVVQGDWKKSIGMPVTLGQNLFEIAELETMSAEVRLTAFDLGQIHVGDKVTIRSDSSGPTSFDGEIGRIEPRATVLDEQAVFIADVVIKDTKMQLRPGMKAKAQIQAGWRSVGWILFARPYRWLANQWIW